MKINDIGTVVSVNTGTDISTATEHTIKVQKPSGASVSWDATLNPDNASIDHTIVAGDLDETGLYILVANIVMPTGTWEGDAVPLEVKGEFE